MANISSSLSLHAIRALASIAVAACATEHERDTRCEEFYRADVAELGPIPWSPYCKAWWDAVLDTDFPGSPLVIACRMREGRATRADLLAALGMASGAALAEAA